MFKVIRRFLNSFRSTESSVQPEKPFSIDHEWPFPFPKPTDEAYLVGELIKGVEKEGDHVFFFWGGEKRRHIRTPDGRETVLARNLIWWMEGRKVPVTSAGTGISTNCGEPKCIKLSHLTLRVRNDMHGPKNRERHVNHVVKRSKQPPVVKLSKTRKISVDDIPKFTPEDRLKCDTRKGWLPTRKAAEERAALLNRKEIRGEGPRQYAYDCQQCDGYHLTKTKPEKFAEKVVGSW